MIFFSKTFPVCTFLINFAIKLYHYIMFYKKLLFTLALTVASHYSAKAQLVINELMQSNVECIMDDLNEFPDSWVELFNSGSEAVNLKDYQISNKNKVKKAWQLPDMTVEPNSYVIIYCDKEGIEDKPLHADFRLESGKGCTVYLFKDKKAEPVDSLPYIDEKPLPKMPAPDVAFGRKTDGAAEWDTSSHRHLVRPTQARYARPSRL